MISARNLEFEVPIGRDKIKSIVKNVSLEVKAGSICGIVGKNGAGKSTLIKILSGFLRPSSGEVEIDNRNIKDFSANELALKRGVLSQEIPVSFGLSVLDILLMGRYPHGKLSSSDYDLVDKVIESLGLAPLLSTSYPSLSGGERQKVQFARTLCQILPLDAGQRKVLFLDEPLAALDLSVQQLILNRVKELVKEFGLTVVFVLHDLNYIARHCSQVFLLEAGQCALKGTPTEVFTELNLRNYFDVNSKVMMSDSNYPIMIFN